MTKKEAIKIFEEKKVRTLWDDETEEWYFSIVDVISILTESIDGRKYWNKLKQRLKEEGSELVTNCHRFNLCIFPAVVGDNISLAIYAIFSASLFSSIFRIRRTISFVTESESRYDFII